MNFSKILRLLVISALMIAALALFACGETPADSEKESSVETESQDVECKHEASSVNDKCESVCADCGVVLGKVDHTPADPDAEDHCNVKCSNCGTLLEENKHGKTVVDSQCYDACENCGDRFSAKPKHTKSNPDPEDHCNINCANCGITLMAGKHPGPVEINDKCEVVCCDCGDKMTNELKHLEPADDAWAYDPKLPQSLSATCERCGGIAYKDVSSTPQGLTFFGPDAISAMLYNARLGITVDRDENGLKYARLKITEAGEGTLTLNDGKQALMGVGKYVAVLARRNGIASKGVEVWINAAGKIDHNGAKAITQPIGNDGSWQLLLFDFSDATQIDKEKGIGWTRLDMNPDNNKGDTMDIAFIAFFDSADEAKNYYVEYIRAYLGPDGCSHASLNNEWKALGNGKIGMSCNACNGDVNVTDCTHFDISKLSNLTPKATADTCYFTADCALCGATGADIPSLTEEQGRVLWASELNALAFVQAALGLEGNASYSRYSAEYITNDGSLPYTRFVSKLAHENCLLLNDGTKAFMGVNKYVAILYRKTGNSPTFELFITAKGSTAPGNHTNKTGDTVNDGTWRLAIIDLSSSTRVDPVNGCGWLRLDVLNNPDVAVGDTVDIAYVGFFGSTEKAYEHYMDYLAKYLGVENCCHAFSTEWVGNGEANKMKNTCDICKQVVVKDCEHVSNGTWSKTETEGVIKSTCTRCNAEFLANCEHLDKTFNSEAGFFHYSFTCNVCGVFVDEENKNSKDALYIFDAETIAGIAGETISNANGTFNTTLLTDASGFKYTHSVLSGATKNECTLYLNRLENGVIESTGSYFAVLYRQNGTGNTSGECFISSTETLGGGNGNRQVYSINGEWTLVIFDFSNSSGWKSKDGAATVRLDMFNTKNIPDGSYFDIAYAGFFSSVDTANEFYNEFAAAYGLK